MKRRENKIYPVSLQRSGVYRIIDANLNRSQEGLRVCEEIIRFIFNDIRLTRKAKMLRHSIVTAAKLLPLSPRELLKARDSSSDVGKNSSKCEKKRNDHKEIFLANIQRVKESLRVLEEFSKIINERLSEKFKLIRYKIYILESETLNKFF